VLDQAARLFREGNPLVMIVTGQTDSAGDAEHNLSLSIQRADTVAKALVSRGIPASRLQVLGKGESEPLVHSADSVAVPENRVAIISWR
jgi:OOP family OmpA-OmpF porin